jgi:hypothetical protein
MSQAPFVQPPRIAVWFVDLFIPYEQEESIPGELLEEFSDLASKSGLVSAHRWYWRQTAKTIVGLIGKGFREAPWLMLGAVFGAFLFLGFTTSRLQRAIVVIFHLHNHLVAHDSKSVDTYFFWLKTRVLIASLFESLIIGSFVAVAAKGREMVVTVTLSFVSLVMTAMIFGVSVARHEPVDPALFPAIMVQQLSCSCMIVIGGVIVRESRSAMSRRTPASR